MKPGGHGRGVRRRGWSGLMLTQLIKARGGTVIGLV